MKHTIVSMMIILGMISCKKDSGNGDNSTTTSTTSTTSTTTSTPTKQTIELKGTKWYKETAYWLFNNSGKLTQRAAGGSSESYSETTSDYKIIAPDTLQITSRTQTVFMDGQTTTLPYNDGSVVKFTARISNDSLYLKEFTKGEFFVGKK